MSRRGAIGIVWVAAMLSLASACSSRKHLTPAAPPEATYEWLTAKMTMDLTAPGTEFNDITGTLRMRRDSTIWISASAFLGVESLRALITPDSVVVVNRMDQTYLAEPLAEVAARYRWPASFQETQAMMLGDHAELQFGRYTAKIRFSDIHWNEPTTFPIKINKNYQRIKP